MRLMRNFPAGVLLGVLIWIALPSAKAAGLPDLAPIQPAGWSDKMVISNGTKNTLGTSPIFNTDTIYINMAFTNASAVAIPAAPVFSITLTLDGALFATFTQAGMAANQTQTITDFNIGSLGVGTHTLTMTLDSGNVIAESNENNNAFTKSFQVTVPPPVITSTLTANGQDGQPFFYQITATNNPLSFGAGITGGTLLPVGLTFDPIKGIISGTPADVTTNVGTVNIILTANNSGGTDTKTLVLTLAADPPHITSPLTAHGSLGVQFDYFVTATGTPQLLLLATPLPAGLIQTIFGIGGVPTEAGTTLVNLTVSNASPQSDTRQLIIDVTAPPIIISPLIIPSAVGTPLSYTVIASATGTGPGGNPLSFATGALPNGLSFNSQTGIISGTPTAAGTFLTQVTAKNGLNGSTNPCVFDNTVGTGTGTLTFAIGTSAGAPAITSSNVAAGTESLPFIYGISATNTAGVATVNRSRSGSIATLITASAHNLLPGQPVQVTGVGGTGYNGNFTVLAVSSSTSFTYTDVAADEASTADPNGLVNGTQYSALGLPPGLNCDPFTGVISGIPGVVAVAPAAVATTNRSRNGNIATLTTAAAHNLFAGQVVTVTNVSGAVLTTTNRKRTNNFATLTFAGPPNLNPGDQVLISNVGSPVGTTMRQRTAGVATLTTIANHNLSVGSAVTISGVGGSVSVGTANRSRTSNVATLTTSAAHNLVIGQTVTITNVGGSVQTSNRSRTNGIATLTTAIPHNLIPGQVVIVSGAGGTVSTTFRSRATNICTLTTAVPHNLVSGSVVTVSGVSGSGYNGVDFTVLSVPSPTTFSYIHTGADEANTADNGGVVQVPGYNGAVVVETVPAPNQLTYNSPGTDEASVVDNGGTIQVAGYNGTFLVTSTPTASSFTYTDNGPDEAVQNDAGGNVSSTGYNGNFIVTSVPTLTTFTYADTAADEALTPDGGGTVIVTGYNGIAVVLIVTPTQITYADAGVDEPLTADGGGMVSSTAYNGTFIVSSVPSATTFSYADFGANENNTVDNGGTVQGSVPPITSIVALSATNSMGSGSATLSITINPAAPTIIGNNVPISLSCGNVANVQVVDQVTATVLTPFSYQVVATGFTDPSISATTYSIVFSPVLPSGNISIDANTGLISGTAAAGDANNYTVTITARNNRSVDTKSLTLLMNGQTGNSPGLINPPFLTKAVIGCPFTYQINAPGAICYSTVDPLTNLQTLPSHLVLNSSTGQISGTLQPGDPTGLLHVSLTTLITINTKCDTTADHKTLCLNVFSSAPATVQPSFITNNSQVPPFPPNIAGNRNPEAGFATIGTQFTPQLSLATSPSISNATTPLPLFVSTSPLPNGLALQPSTTSILGDPAAQITGIATNIGTSNVTITALNSAGSDTRTLTITVAGVVITSPLAAGGQVGRPFTYAAAASGNANKFNANNLPPGLAIDVNSGIISGIPVQPGTFSVTLSASNAFNTGTAVLIIKIDPAPLGSPVITSRLTGGGGPTAPAMSSIDGLAFTAPPSPTPVLANLAPPTAGQQYQITATNNPTKFNALGLPAGLTVDNVTGAITGATASVGTYNITLVASNAAGSNAALMILQIFPFPPSITSSLNVTALVGTPFTYFLTAIGTQSITFTAVSPGPGLPPLPIGFTLNGNVIQGTFSALPPNGLQTITIQASNAAPQTDTKTINIKVLQAPLITSTLTDTAQVASAFSYTIQASGTSPFTFTAAPIPSGLQFNGTSITGTPLIANPSFDVTLTATNATGLFDTQHLIITINPLPPPPSINSPLTASGQAGSPFTYLITATASATQTPLTFGTSALPPGLSLNGANISGTPTQAGVFNVTLSATDVLGQTGTTAPASPLVITITAVAPPVITSAGSANGAVGSFFSYTITATGPAPITFNAPPPQPLPPGLAFDGTSVISGTPTQSGTFSISLVASNPGGQVTQLLILTIPPSITSALAVNGTTGTPFSYTITASGPAPAVFTASPLPPGLTFSGAAISGTPTATGTFDVNLTAAPASGPPAPPAVLVITITAPPTPAVFTSALTANGSVGVQFNFVIAATGTAPITFSAAPLPPGLSFSQSAISGVPSAAGTFSVNLVATNVLGPTPATLVVTIAPPQPPTITSTLAASGTIGAPFGYTITATGIGPITFNATSLPTGFSDTGAAISGTPTVAGTFNITISASNSSGQTNAVLVLTIPVPPGITSALTDSGTVNVPYSYQIAASPGPASGFSTTPLPAGLTVDPNTGIISGTPISAGIFSITLAANTPAGPVSAVLTLTINSPAPIITSPLTASGAQGVAFTYTITATGAPVISFTASPLPDGLVLSGATITGIPTQAAAAVGVFSVNLVAHNSFSPDDHETLVITIAPAPAIDANGFPTELVNILGMEPFGGKSPKLSRVLNVTSTLIRLNFVQQGKDSINIKGSFSAPNGFFIANQQITFVCGGIVENFTLDSKGNSPNGNNTFRARVKVFKGSNADVIASFTVKLNNGIFAPTLKAQGLTDDPTLKGVSRTVDMFLLVPNQLFLYNSSKVLTYTVTKNARTGLAKQTH